MNEKSELLAEIEKEEKILKNGGVFKKSLFQKISSKLSNAALTLTLVGSLIGVSVPRYANAQQKEVAIIQVSKEAQDKLINYMKYAEESIINHKYDNAQVLIKKLDSAATKMNDKELKNINNKLKLLLEETKKENTPIRTVLKDIHVTTELGDVSYKVAKTSINKEDVGNLELYKNQLKYYLSGRDRNISEITIDTKEHNGRIELIAKKRI